MIRLQKFLAECGVASRRASEKLIVEGRVSVDGRVVTELGTKIDPDTQRVSFDGKPVMREEKIWLMLNKPTGVICTSDDPEGRERVIDLVSGVKGRLYTVGRLDVMSEGLIVLTNDGELAHRLMHPRHHIEKKYQVWINQSLSEGDVAQLKRGVNCSGETLRALAVTPLERSLKGSPGYTLTLGEGRNRHIRRMMEAIDRKVVRLLRVSVGPLRLDRLRTGEYRELAPWELDKLKKSVGLTD